MKTTILLFTTLFTLSATAQTDSTKILYEGTVVTVELLEDISRQ